MWNHACEHNLQAPYSLQQIAEMQGLEFFHNDINFHLIVLLENLIANACAYPDMEVLIAIFDKVDAMPLSDARRTGFHVLYSDLFVWYGQLNAALIQRSKAFQLNPVPGIAYRQAVMSASAGNYEDALVFLDRARQAQQQSSMFTPSIAGDIETMERDLRQVIQARQ